MDVCTALFISTVYPAHSNIRHDHAPLLVWYDLTWWEDNVSFRRGGNSRYWEARWNPSDGESC